jgi:carbamoyl-phosphate synthase small subunit
VAAPKEAEFKTVYGSGRVSHISLNDSVVEGLEMVSIPAFSVQYHPESAAGPHDASYLFERFVKLMENPRIGLKDSNA